MMAFVVDVGSETSGDEGSVDFGRVVVEVAEAGGFEDVRHYGVAVDDGGGVVAASMTAASKTAWIGEGESYESEEGNLKG